jgi:hypothetical protein
MSSRRTVIRAAFDDMTRRRDVVGLFQPRILYFVTRVNKVITGAARRGVLQDPKQCFKSDDWRLR